MMKLDEAIKHAEEKTKEHEQLAEWLKELKRVRELPWLKELKALREQKRPRGEWLPQDEFEEIFKCSNCGVEMRIEYNFCPNCGADMRKEGEENGQ